MLSEGFSRRLARLAAMDSCELLYRTRQELSKRIDHLLFRAGYDFASKESLVTSPKEARFFFASADVPTIVDCLLGRLPDQVNAILSQAEKIRSHRFDLLGYENLDYGKHVDWQLDCVHSTRAPQRIFYQVQYLDFTEVGDSKVTWELNRHQHLVTLAKAYRIGGNQKILAEILQQLQEWEQGNRYPMGVNWASSLEVAFRSMAWCWVYHLLKDSPAEPTRFRERWLRGQALHGRHIERYLSTYFSPNTHFLGEAVALFFLGTLCPEISCSTRWQRKGWQILGSEARKQVFKDGFYFEQSTYYHVYALDLLLHARILAGLNEIPIPSEFDQILQQMLHALLLLSRAGIALRIGDDDGGRVFDPRRNRTEHLTDPLATGAILYGRGDFKFLCGSPPEETLWLLGSKGLEKFESLESVEPSVDSVALADSGLYLMADVESAQQLLIDAGPLGSGNAGHGHADALSVCLVRNGRNLLMDPGTFEYVGNSGERDRLRGTSAHNTMQVDGQDQAEATGPFSWKNRLRVKVEQWVTGQRFDLFEGSHDGYSRLLSPVTHRRWVFHRKETFWLVLDRAEGHGQHRLDIAWHIGSTLSPAPSKEHVFADRQASLALLTAEGHGWAESIRRDYWSPAYGQRERANVVNFGALVDLPADFATLLVPEAIAQGDLGCLARMNTVDSSATSAFRYSKGGQEHNFVFAHQPGSWVCGPWTSDADFVYWSFDREKEQYTLILCNGSYAEAGRRRVLSCRKRVSYAEVLSSATKVDLFSSDPDNVLLQQPLDSALADVNLMAPEIGPKKMGV